MVTSESRLAYTDCFNVMEQAVSEAYPKGIRIKCASIEDATNLRLRLHKARKIDRIDNKEIYQPGDHMYGRSIYDGITCRIRPFDGGAWLRLERLDAIEYEIESLSEPPSEPESLPEPLPIPTVVENRVVIPIRSRMLRRM